MNFMIFYFIVYNNIIYILIKLVDISRYVPLKIEVPVSTTSILGKHETANWGKRVGKLIVFAWLTVPLSSKTWYRDDKD